MGSNGKGYTCTDIYNSYTVNIKRNANPLVI